MVDYPTVILVSLFFGLLGAYIAPKRNRNPLVWFTVGFLFSLCGLVFLFILPRAEPQKKPAKPKPLPPLAPKPHSEALMKMWYYLDDSHKTYGPVDFSLLNKSWEKNEISEKSYLWAEGMEKWEKIEKLPEIHKELAKI